MVRVIRLHQMQSKKPQTFETQTQTQTISEPKNFWMIERFLWVDSKKVATSGAGPSLSNAKSKVENMSIVIATTITIRPNSRQACLIYCLSWNRGENYLCAHLSIEIFSSTNRNISIFGISKTILCLHDFFAWCKV